MEAATVYSLARNFLRDCLLCAQTLPPPNIFRRQIVHCCWKCSQSSILLLVTAVKSNALAELMNRASKIHWKNLSLTLNGRNSETKNDKNNPKVPFFQYVQLLRNISFLLKWSFLAKICCCCQMCYFPKLSIFFKMCVVCKMFGLGHNVRFFSKWFLSKCMFLVKIWCFCENFRFGQNVCFSFRLCRNVQFCQYARFCQNVHFFVKMYNFW